ncbi:hypothetical protein KP004_07850 [Geomonas oryzisoli]|uniref:DUF8201 domain-containing protein n=1 Tax=Geomonas oryzisoli TaxID=2847992 RepID=A0ABX8J9G7_9BACT|nr:hypothetical protein [Geomonas oryzisoli]QWV95080.1 hypothetical protein KP004_07850 [Geomonas oryzisoli]
MSHPTALALALSLYLFVAAAYYGLGKGVARVLGMAAGSDKPAHSVMSLIWLGWACALFLFQLLHFFLPIASQVSLPVFSAGALCCLVCLARGGRRPSPSGSCTPVPVAGAILMLVLASWLVSRAMLPPTNYDTGLYHLNAIRWINTYPVVPGLGNLHGRLAFNQSFFTFAASLTVPPVFEHGRFLGNALLFLFVAATAWTSLTPVLRRPSLIVEAHPFRFLPSLFLLPVLAFIAISSNGIASPAPDLASLLLQCCIFLLLGEGIADWQDGHQDQDYRVMLLLLLASAAVTVKLSNLAFSSVIVCFAVAYWLKTRGRTIRSGFTLFTPPLLMFLVWAGQGVMLSGVPLYPSTAGRLPVDWAVPVERIVSEAQSVYSWARTPGASPKDVLHNWGWFRPWLVRVATGNVLDVTYPLLQFLFFGICALIAGLFSKVRRRNLLQWAYLVPAVMSLVFWFCTAPDPRFANAAFFLLSIASALVFLCSVQGLLSSRLYADMICLVFLIGNLLLVRHLVYNASEIRAISTSGWHQVQRVALETRKTSSGLTVYTPCEGDQCWDSALPSTPYFNPHLRLRERNSVASGFTVM